MKNYQLIRSYIKVLLESNTIENTDLNDLETSYQSEIQAKNKEHQIQGKLQNLSGKGWGLLNTTIEKFKELDDPNLYQTGDRYQLKTQMLQDVLSKELGFTHLGEGYFRNVWGSPNANFIVKIEKKVMNYSTNQISLEGTNESEYMRYLYNGTDFEPRNDLFPKMYAYDTQDKAWIIFEKVNTFSTSNVAPLEKIFGPFSLLCQKILFVLMHEPAFTQDPWGTFAINSPTYKIISNPQSDPVAFFDIIFRFALCHIGTYYKNWGDLKIAFHHLVLDFILVTLLEDGLSIPNNKKKYKLFKQKLLENLGQELLTPTPDALHVCKFLKDSDLVDLHFYNLGYRDLKNNPDQPWKNLVILDFGGYGNWKNKNP